MGTPYQSAYWAHALTLRGPSGGIEALSRSIANARVDLNPHQVDAALFAMRSPLSKGVILADEVGLGKTIEAGLVLSQRWAERRRKLLIIVPATLRTQWQQELEDKFHLPSLILETRAFNRLRGDGVANPFDDGRQIIICSYQFAAARKAEVAAVRWDLAVIDEAHRLRNVQRTDAKTARAINEALAGVSKLLLTATPLQNSLNELYGLVSVIDPHVFGDEVSFREQFVRATAEERRNTELRERLRSFVARTLRKQVREYIRFTERVPIAQEFVPSDAEQALYEAVSAYLQRDVLLALPASQRSLITMVLRKLLASSSFAVGGTLRNMIARLERQAATSGPALDLELGEDFDTLGEESDEWEADDAPDDDAGPADTRLLLDELAALRNYAALAESIHDNAKGQALLTALDTALAQAVALGARRKAVVFTESRRTQAYLAELLAANGYAGDVVLLSGTNTDARSRAIYDGWLQRHPERARGGSRAVDSKAALIEEFSERGTILLATEAAAEGVNLQFCSLVVNYDLPWNPQRVEQRIGRCHRYGQQHDVVVVNFLNRRNAADQRVYELLRDKFRLFSGVFGASDEVLGALESGVDIERRIADVYQTCRTETEITAAFDRLQADLDVEIVARMAQTRQSLLEHFDEEVHSRLEVHRDAARQALTERGELLWDLTRAELDADAAFDDSEPRFLYDGPLGPSGWYGLEWKRAEERGDYFYRPDHELAVAVIDQALSRALPPAELRFDYAAYGANIAALEPYLGARGWLELGRLTVESLATEEFLVFGATTDDGRELDDDLCAKLLKLPARAAGAPAGAEPPVRLQAALDAAVAGRLREVRERNIAYVDEEVAKLEHWSDDLKFGLEREIREIDREIRDARKQSRLALDLTEKLAAQRLQRDLEQRRMARRRELYDAQDRIDAQREELISAMEEQQRESRTLTPIFRVRWQLR